MPVSVTKIGRYAFRGCGNLSDVYYAGTWEQWNSISLDADTIIGAEIHCTDSSTEDDDVKVVYPDEDDSELVLEGAIVSMETLGQEYSYTVSDMETEKVNFSFTPEADGIYYFEDFARTQGSSSGCGYARTVPLVCENGDIEPVTEDLSDEDENVSYDGEYSLYLDAYYLYELEAGITYYCTFFDFESDDGEKVTVYLTAYTYPNSYDNTEVDVDINDCIIGLSEDTYIYDGFAKEPTVIVTCDGETLTSGTDYTVEYSNSTDAGTATVTVTGTGNYTGTATATFTISKASQIVTVSAGSSSIIYGETTTISASTTGDGALSYSSDNESVATVDGNGKVTAVGVGTATITITASETSNYNSATATVDITVEEASQIVTASAVSDSITCGKTTTISASTTGDGSLSYSSSNTSVATVNSSGVVTAKGAGTATITVTASATGNYNAGTSTVSITVTRASQTLSVSSSSVTLAAGKTSTLTVSGAKTTLSYSSSDTSVATVNSSGVITAKEVGTVTITVTAAQTSQYAKATKTITVKVKPVAPTNVSVKNISSGVKITWDKVTGATGYYVYRSTSKSGTYTKIATITSGSTKTYTNKTSGNNKAVNAKTYYYKVYAYASTGTSSASSVKSIRYITAGKVSSLTNTSSGITVKWSKVSGATGYYIYRKAGSGDYTKIATVTGASTVSYKNKTSGTYKVSNGTTYKYYVIPYYKNSSGTVTMGSYSNTRTIIYLTAGKLSSVKNSSSKKITVKWSKNSKAAGYQIQYSTSSSFASSKTKTVKVSSKSTVSKTISNLTKGKTYYVRVRSYKKSGDNTYYSSWSSKKSVKISK